MDSRSKQTVLAVDDVPENIRVLTSILEGDYRITAATSGNQALEVASASPPPDLILLDVQMPGMDGFEVCRKLKASAATRDIPVIFVTALDETADENMGFQLGAVDYITKPVVASIVKARVQTQLALSHQNRELEKMVRERTIELQNVQDVTIFGLSLLAEYRDNETGAHILRTKEYVGMIARKLLNHPKFRNLVNEEMAELLYKSAPLHDIGKVGIPDSILLKPGKLTPEEFDIIKKHTVYGSEVIRRSEATMGVKGDLSFLRIARDITISHHERWDGKGYPNGLAGEAIPLSGRIMALADVYDALISKRVYKPALPQEEVLEIMAKGRGDHFDPDLFDVFWALSGEFQDIAKSIQDAAIA